MVDDEFGRFAIDFGASSMVALSQIGVDPAGIDLVLLSHLHGDHFGALPFLLLHREFVAPSPKPLTLAGPIGFVSRVRDLMECMFPGLWKDKWRFDLNFVEIDPAQSSTIMGRQVSAQKANHFAGPQDALSLRIETGGRIITFSGDTGWLDELIDFSNGSDLFICECNDLADQPYEGHVSYETLSKKIDALQTKQLLLTHLGPSMIDAIKDLPVQAATSGLKLEI